MGKTEKVEQKYNRAKTQQGSATSAETEDSQGWEESHDAPDTSLNFAPVRHADENIVTRAMEGDPDAVEQVIQLHYQDILYFAMKKVGPQEGADVAQHAIAHIIKDISNLKDPAKFKSWMMSLVYHNCMEYMRSMYSNDQKVVIDVNAVAYVADKHPETDPEKIMVAAEDRETILSIIDSMPDNYADCIRLRYYDGMSNPEIAEVLGVDEKKVRNDMHRSHALFRKRFEELSGKAFAAAPLGILPGLSPVLAAEKAELVTTDIANSVFAWAQETITATYGPASGVAHTGATVAQHGLSTAKIVGISGAAAALVAGAALTFALAPSQESPQAEPEPAPIEQQAPAEAVKPINTIQDMIGDQEAQQLFSYVASGTDANTWEAFCQHIGATERDIALEPDHTYHLFTLEKQDKQLLLASKTSTADGTTTVLYSFGEKAELPEMPRVILMFP